jgi:hypothetical protein
VEPPRPAESRAEPPVASRPGPASCPGHPGLDERGTVSSRAVQGQGNGRGIGPRRYPTRDRPPSRVGLDPSPSLNPNCQTARPPSISSFRGGHSSRDSVPRAGPPAEIGFALRRDRDGVGFALVIARTGSTRRTPPAVAGPGASARGIGFLVNTTRAFALALKGKRRAALASTHLHGAGCRGVAGRVGSGAGTGSSFEGPGRPAIGITRSPRFVRKRARSRSRTPGALQSGQAAGPALFGRRVELGFVRQGRMAGLDDDRGRTRRSLSDPAGE